MSAKYMDLTPYQKKCLYLKTKDDEAEFSEIASKLPLRISSTPYHCGPHSLRSLRAAYRLCDVPRRVLEIGFCLGHSASMWFGFGAERVQSIDVSERVQTVEAARTMKTHYGDAFDLLISSSERLTTWEPKETYGMIFIDGGHEFQDVVNDIKLGRRLKIPFFVFDDFFPEWGPGVQPAIEDQGLVLLAVIGNQAVCVPPDGYR